MAKKNVVIFDGEDKFINPKKAVYSKTRGQSKKVDSFKSVRAALEDEQGPTQSVSEGIADDTVNNQASMGAPASSSVSAAPASYNPTVASPVDVPSPAVIADKIEAAVLPNIGTSTITQETVAAPAYTAPTPALPSSPPSGTTKTCPSGMREYFGTCIPITNTQGACQQGYMKEYVGGPCVPIPASDAIGNCAAGYEYKMGMRAGSLTPEMGCYPIGSTQDIGTGSSTGAILGGGAGSNIGGGGTVQGGGGSYVETPEGKIGIGAGDTIAGITCNENQVYDPKTGSCIAKYTPAPVPCPAGFTLNKATGTCIESLNPQDYKCPPVDLPTPPKCKKYAVIGKDQFGCDRYELVDDAANCPSVINPAPLKCEDGLIWSEAEQKCKNPIDETKRPPLTTPEGTCPVGFRWNIPAQKCVALCDGGLVWDPVNLMCVEPKKNEPAPTPYCSKNMVWDPVTQKCVFTGTVAPAPVTSQTTTTTTKAPSDTLGILPVTPIGGGGTSGGGGGGGGSEEPAAAAAAKKNYFWWYVGGAVLAYYLYKKYKKKK